MNIKYCDETALLYMGGKAAMDIVEPEVMPIYNSTAYIIKDTYDYDFASNGGKYYYSRTANPNRDALASTITFMENGDDTIVCSSGMSAIATALFSLLKTGDHILFNTSIYGETIEIAEEMLKEFGIEVSYADFTDMDAIKKSVRPNTKILYTEIVANPLTLVVDIASITEYAHKNDILVVVDSTFTTPFAIRPLDFGADVVLHSLTKYFGGHSDITGGSVTARTTVIDRIRHKSILMGGCMDPNTAWLTQRSIKTMPMRVKTQFANALEIAKALEKNPYVKKVHYPGLENHPQHELAKKILNSYGGIISFRVEDDRKKVNEFIRRLEIIKYLGTLGGIKTTLAHPASAFRNEFTQEELENMGMYEGLIRISTGIENSADLINDLNRALEAFK